MHVQSGSREAPTFASLLQTLCHSLPSVSIPSFTLQCVVPMERLALETAEGTEAPAPSGHVLRLYWTHSPEDPPDALWDIDPPPLKGPFRPLRGLFAGRISKS